MRSCVPGRIVDVEVELDLGLVAHGQLARGGLEPDIAIAARRHDVGLGRPFRQEGERLAQHPLLLEPAGWMLRTKLAGASTW